MRPILFLAAVLLASPCFAAPSELDLKMTHARYLAVIAMAKVDTSPSPDPSPPQPRPVTSCPVGCECKGTGKVRSGDGLHEFPCECAGTACPCQRARANSPSAFGPAGPVVLPRIAQSALDWLDQCTREDGCPDPSLTLPPPSPPATDSLAKAQPPIVSSLPEKQVAVVTMANCKACPDVEAAAQSLAGTGLAVSGDPNATIRMVTREENPDLIQEWGVTSYPTVIVLRRGRVVSRLVGRPAIAITSKALGELATQEIMQQAAPPQAVQKPTATSSIRIWQQPATTQTWTTGTTRTIWTFEPRRTRRGRRG